MYREESSVSGRTYYFKESRGNMTETWVKEIKDEVALQLCACDHCTKLKKAQKQD